MSPTVRIDDEVYEALKKQAEPFIDTPNTVLRRVLGLGAPAIVDAEDGGLAEVSDKKKPTRAAASAGRRPKARGARGAGRSARAAKGSLLPESEYELPLLTILSGNGGQMATRDVIRELEGRLEGKLMPADLEALPTGGVRWKQRAQFVRLRLVESGDLVADSPRGLWEISGQGRARLKGASA